VPDSFLSRRQRFHSVGSTNDVVRDWLAGGVAEVALAVADEQTAGRGREGRTWTAPRGAALLASAGFRPTWISPERAWRIPATISLAMAEAAEETAGLADRAIRLKWPNDLVLEDGNGTIRKLAGVLGESDGLGSGDPRVVVGIGVNADWPADHFPAELASSMTSLRVASGDRPVDLTALLDGFTMRLESRIGALRAGSFDVAAFAARQLTDGRTVRLELPDGTAEEVRAITVDPETGALVVEAGRAPGGQRQVFSGEIRHVRLAEGPVHSASGV
jgi:BirA family biotin operon repressor/biotin-[acetyl-CoA-carboxylase] ligase